LPRFELLSLRGVYNLLFTRRTRVFELYVRGLAVARAASRCVDTLCPFISLGKKARATFFLLLLALR